MKRRSYLAALVDGGGNVPPELGAVRRLLERGHAVTVLAENSTAAEVRATGASFRPWVRAPNRTDRRPENDLSRDWECKYPWQLIGRLSETLLIGPSDGYAEDASRAIADCRPSVVICSMFCLGAMAAAEAAGIPFVVLFTTVYPLPARGMPPFGIGLQPARGSFGRWRDRLLNGLIEVLWDGYGLVGFNALRARHGLPPLKHVFDQVRNAHRQLILTSAAFDFPAELPVNARYAGPVLDDPEWSRTSVWTPPAGDKPLVLVALSSTFQDQIGTLQRVIDSLATLPVHTFVTTGPAVDSAGLRTPANATIVAAAPHSSVLRHTSVVVTHGGHGTVTRALAAGVPMVILPHGRDQADVATRVTARGAGVALARTALPASIASAVRRVLEDAGYRTAAESLGERIRRDAGTETLVRELEAVPQAFGETLRPTSR